MLCFKPKCSPNILIKVFLKTNRNLFLVLFGIFFLNTTYCQVSDIFRIEYSYFPQSNSENNADRFRGFANFPIRMSWEGSYLIPGNEYRNFNLDIEDPVPFETGELRNFQSFRISLAYTFKMKKDWRFAARTGFEVASNFETRGVSNGDLRYSGAVYLIKDRGGEDYEKPNRLIIGLEYSTNAGRPFPIPIVNYYRQFRPNWSYSVGSPKTNLKHTFSKRHSLQAYISLDGFFSNIQNDLAVNQQDNTVLADNISMTIVLGGLGYEYEFLDHFSFYAYGAYTFFNEIRLRDASRNNLYTINNDNTSYLRTGIKFKI